MNAFIRPKTLLALALTGVAGTALLLAQPSWWVTRGARDPALPASDYGPLNQGQLKNLARAARDEMETQFPGGAGTAINTLVNSWATPTADTSDYAAVNVGQLKAVAELFYQRYEQLGISVTRPWTGATGDDLDYSAANIGQAKNAFSFAVLGDSDGDGVNDTWEMANFGTLDRDLSLDADGDGLSDYAEYLAQLNPLKWDSDGDGIADSTGAQGALGLVLYTMNAR
jgi:hypothetical protein